MFIKTQFQKLTGKKHVYLLDRCNTAIKFVQQKYKGKTFLLQDQGGWFTYRNAKIKQFIQTDYGLISEIPQIPNSVLLINSMPGYHAVQQMQNLRVPKDCIIINDVSGSIGTENAKIGDIIIGSFGKWKPINLNYGGFLASNFKLEINENFNPGYSVKLGQKLQDLSRRLEFLKSTAKKIKSELANYQIIHRNHNAINIIVAFSTEAEKNEIIKYCNANNLPYTVCPRYIRVNTSAISIEVKRL